MTNTPPDSAARPGLHSLFLQAPPLTPDLERRFQTNLYARIRPGLRLISLLLAGLVAAQTLLQSRAPAPSDLAVSVPQIVFWLCVFGLTRAPGFARVWRPALVLMGWAAAILALGGLGHTLGGAGSPPPGPANPPPPVPQLKFFFALQMTVLMVTLSTLRLPFRWAALLQGGVLVIGLWAVRRGLPLNLLPDLHFILLPALVLLLALLLAAYTQEQLARVAFYAGALPLEERNDERRQRAQTEGQLRVLAQAIGGIVHDLGNPLTSVQLGAETLTTFLDDEAPDRALLREFAGTIQDGAEMLNALRLFLIEQVRVLEGRPIPVDLRPEPLRPIVEAGDRFQSPRLAGGRTVALEGGVLEVRADRLKLSTVFMNLIGNALKYSDGDVRVVWRTDGDRVLVGVLDRGTAGRGISEAEARRLFVAFGRLEAHAQVEGTGLGLVSARKVVEAHGGEIFIQGHPDGAPASPPFTTARSRCSDLLAPGFLTAFVVVWPGGAVLSL